LPAIPSRRNATKKAYCPKRFYRQRHKIENFLLPLQGLAAHCYEIRQARPQLPRRHFDDWHALLDQVMSPDPS
jgi:hypothetical protein